MHHSTTKTYISGDTRVSDRLGAARCSKTLDEFEDSDVSGQECEVEVDIVRATDREEVKMDYDETKEEGLCQDGEKIFDLAVKESSI